MDQGHFKVTDYKKFTDRVSDTTLQLTLKKPPLSKFGYRIKEKHSQLSEKATKILLSFPTVCLYKVGFCSLTSTQNHISQQRE